MATKRNLPSLRKAINAFCKMCIVDPEPGNGSPLEQITNCTSKTCPLYKVRPTSRKQGKTDVKKE